MAKRAAELHKKTPLWYYILKEAQVRRNGEALGPVGSRIVAEVFVGLVHGDNEPTRPRVRTGSRSFPLRCPVPSR